MDHALSATAWSFLHEAAIVRSRIDFLRMRCFLVVDSWAPPSPQRRAVPTAHVSRRVWVPSGSTVDRLRRWAALRPVLASRLQERRRGTLAVLLHRVHRLCVQRLARASERAAELESLASYRSIRLCVSCHTPTSLWRHPARPNQLPLDRPYGARRDSWKACD